MDRADLSLPGGSIDPVSALPLVLGHPGFGSKSRYGRRCGPPVHGEQGITLYAPLPSEGTVVGKTRVVGIIDKGEARRCSIARRLRDAETGALYATTRSTTFLRGDGGFGGPAGPVKAFHIRPDTAPEIVHETVTRPEQALCIAGTATTILHLDPDVAAKAGFQRPILHGLCSSASPPMGWSPLCAKAIRSG